MRISKTTISVALRGKPGVSDELRSRILAQAKAMGYKPDPVASELMAMVRSKRQPVGAETIAFVNTFSDVALFGKIADFRDFFDGAQKHAERYGYRVEMFAARGNGMSAERLAGILRARGVRGVLIGPRWRKEPDIEFPLADFSVVLVGEAEYGPNLFRVCNHHVHSCLTTLTQLSDRGYRKIGLAFISDGETKRGHDYLLGVDQFNRLEIPGVTVRIHLYNQWDEAKFSAWMKKHDLDAVVSLAKEPGCFLDKMRSSGAHTPAYANLSLFDGSVWSGINQHSDQVGAAAVDLLRNLMMAGERGVSSLPRIVLVEGKWVDGETAPMLHRRSATLAEQ